MYNVSDLQLYLPLPQVEGSSAKFRYFIVFLKKIKNLNISSATYG